MLHTLLVCRTQTEAIRLQRHLNQYGLAAEITRPPRQERTESCSFAVRIPAEKTEQALGYLRSAGPTPCKILRTEGYH